jgi:hypothetical protein
MRVDQLGVDRHWGRLLERPADRGELVALELPDLIATEQQHDQRGSTNHVPRIPQSRMLRNPRPPRTDLRRLTASPRSVIAAPTYARAVSGTVRSNSASVTIATSG